MRNPILFSVIAVLLSFATFANEQVPGVVIYENETIHVTFDVPTISFTKEWDFSRLQARAYFHDANGIKSRVTPVEAKEIQLFIESVDTIRLVSVLYRGKSGRTFARLLKEGSIKVYAMEIASSNTTMNNPSHVYGGAPSPGNPAYRASGFTVSGRTPASGYLLLQKPNEGPDARAVRLVTAKQMIEFFKDCPPVVKEIEEQELTGTELPVVVDFYFRDCGSKEEE